jgi:hypothetical protein
MRGPLRFKAIVRSPNVFVLAGALLVAAILWLAMRGYEPAPLPVAESAEAPAPAYRPLRAPPLKPPPATQVDLSIDDRSFASRLREKFAARIGDPHARIKLVEQILAYLEAQGAAGDLARAYALLKSVFPELADALFAKLQGLIAYDSWLAENREALGSMSPSDRRQVLWEARRTLFGEDASAIWAGEVRNEQLESSIEAIAANAQLSTSEKLQKYVGAIEETYGERAKDVVARQQTELLDRFMEIDAVQADLGAMAPEQRRDALREIRSAMGMDEQALHRWDALDAERDRAWAEGQQYVLERDAILARFDGAEQEQQLRALQDRLFGPAAEEIRNEEAAGFHRFAQPRRIGRE